MKQRFSVSVAPSIILCVTILAACGRDAQVTAPLDAPEPTAQVSATLVPLPVPDGTLLQLAAARIVTCALRADLEVICWGWDQYGETAPPPGPFQELSDPFGSHALCGLRPDATADCWGRNFFGEREPPAGTFSSLTGGRDKNCGIRTDGTVVCWGRAAFAGTPPSGTFLSISSGTGHHTCGIRTNGTLVCWGSYFGTGATTPPSGVFTSVAAGENHDCAIDLAGNVSCWGRNLYGEATPPSGAFAQVTTGHLHSCGLRPDGSIECWGRNEYGQSDPPLPNGDYVRVVASYDHNCAVRSDASVVCWGADYVGQLDVPAELSNRPPQARFEVTTSTPLTEGQIVSFDATTSSDPESGVLTYAWSFGDERTGEGAVVDHVFVDDGSYLVSLTVTDPFGRSDLSEELTPEIYNVPPSLTTLPDAILVPGESYTADGAFADPGADTWTGFVDWGQGLSYEPLALDPSGKSYALNHRYDVAGTFLLGVKIVDDDGGEGSTGALVTVLSPSEGVGELSDLLDELQSQGLVPEGPANALESTLDRAAQLLAEGSPAGEAILAKGFVRQVESLLRRGAIDGTTAEALLDWVDRILASLAT